MEPGQLIQGEITRACTDTVSDNQICASTVGSGKGVNFFLILLLTKVDSAGMVGWLLTWDSFSQIIKAGP